jgi:hypothetical protein
MTAPHLPRRPSWHCQACPAAWPCAPARTELARDFDPVGLAMHMGSLLIDAARDMPTTKPEKLFDRFLRWTHGA